MATTPSTHGRYSSSSSTTSSRSSSPTYRPFPHTAQPSPRNRHISLLQKNIPQHQQQEQQQTSIQSTQTAYQRNFSRPHFHRAHTTIPQIQPANTSTKTAIRTHSHLTNSIERATLPMLAHLNQQLNFARLEPERDRVRRQIQRQETVLTLSGLLKGWGEEEEEERSRWSDDSDDEWED